MLGDELIDQQQLKKKQEKLFEQQKKFRNLEADKKLFAEETINFIKKQKMSIDKLKKENQALKELIAKINNEKNNESKHGLTSESMKEFLNEISNAIQQEKETQKNIDVHIANFQKKIIQKKKNCLGINSGAENLSSLQKQVKILENRLDKANQKFNETIAVNKDLKLVIDSLRKERVIFDNLYKKLQSQLHQKRKKMADIIEKANNAYEDRDKANNQINSLKQQAKKESTDFEKQIKEISHLMEKIKLSSYAKKGGKGQEEHSYNHSVIEQAQNTQGKFIKQTKKSSQQMEKIQKFRQDFAKIEAATEIDNFDELLRIFSRNEQKNFQMFKFVNLQSNEIEQLEYEVAKLKEEDAEGEKNVPNAKEQYLSEMQENLRNVENNLKDTQTKYRTHQKEAKSIMGLIERVFETIQCDREIVKEIGGSKTISETNLLVFLAVIEHKAVSIVETFNRLSNPNMLSSPQGRVGQGQPAILTFEDFEDNEEYDKILTVEELRKKAADFISKEQNQKQKKKEMRPKKK